MKSKKGFTLIELMIVITIIGVLASLLLPMITGAQRATYKAKTKTLFSSLVAGLNRYKDEYGFYPNFLTEKDRVNLNDASNSVNCVRALTGRNPDGTAMSAADRMAVNRNKIHILDFDDSNLVEKRNRTTNKNEWKIVDAFGNPNIYICVDNDGDGLIKKGFPTATDGVNPVDLKNAVKNDKVGIRAGAIVFTLKKDSNSPAADFTSEDIFSWVQ